MGQSGTKASRSVTNCFVQYKHYLIYDCCIASSEMFNCYKVKNGFIDLRTVYVRLVWLLQNEKFHCKSHD